MVLFLNNANLIICELVVDNKPDPILLKHIKIHSNPKFFGFFMNH